MTFTDVNEIPQNLAGSYRIKWLNIMSADLAASYIRINEFTIAYAELQFYYFGNHYYSIELLGQLELASPNSVLRQRIYTLRRKIYGKMIIREKLADNFENMGKQLTCGFTAN